MRAVSTPLGTMIGQSNQELDPHVHPRIARYGVFPDAASVYLCKFLPPT